MSKDSYWLFTKKRIVCAFHDRELLISWCKARFGDHVSEARKDEWPSGRPRSFHEALAGQPPVVRDGSRRIGRRR